MLDLMELMEHPRIAFILSCVIGFGLAAMMRPLCKGPDCIIIRGPDVVKFQNTVYQIGEGCYEFKVKPMLNLYISFLDSYWQNIYFEIPSDKIKNEYKQLLIYGKDCTDETRYTKDRILELTYNFVINYK